MPFNGSGTFVRVHDFTSDRDAGIKIDADRMDAEIDGIATGLSTCLTKDGQQTATADLPMGANKITGLASPTAAQDAATKTYVDTKAQTDIDDRIGELASTGSASAYVLTPTEEASSTIGEQYGFRANHTSGAACTLDVSGEGAKKWYDTDKTTQLAAGDVQDDQYYLIEYDSGLDSPNGGWFTVRSSMNQGWIKSYSQNRTADRDGSLVSGGSASVYTLTTNETVTAYATGDHFVFEANHSSTGVATLNIDTVDAKKWLKADQSTQLDDGDIIAGAVYAVKYDSTLDTGSGAFYLAGEDGSYERLDVRSNTSVSGYVSGNEVFSGGKTASNINVAGCEMRSSGQAIATAQDGVTAVFNRKGSDGIIVGIYGGSVLEGNISISGSTVSYNSFCGSHWGQLTDNSKPDILRGTILETIDELCEWEGEENDRLPKVKVSDTAASNAVYGVFLDWDNDVPDGEENNPAYQMNDMYVAAVGASHVRVQAGQKVKRGDLVESAGDGTARVQADTAIRASTIGKISAAVTIEKFTDGSFLMPAVLYCG